MSGNVWEWTRSLWGPAYGYPYHPGTMRESLEADSDTCRVIRGGAFVEFPRTIRSAFRYGVLPRNRFSAFGFRVIVSAPVSRGAASPVSDLA
jgi:formylglycine-generating enzyme required for sulfatase activity